MPAHIHAKEMMLYAQDATETNEPWTRWEVFDIAGKWMDCLSSPLWLHSRIYRRKHVPVFDEQSNESPIPVLTESP